MSDADCTPGREPRSVVASFCRVLTYQYRYESVFCAFLFSVCIFTWCLWVWLLIPSAVVLPGRDYKKGVDRWRTGDTCRQYHECSPLFAESSEVVFICWFHGILFHQNTHFTLFDKEASASLGLRTPGPLCLWIPLGDFRPQSHAMSPNCVDRSMPVELFCIECCVECCPLTCWNVVFITCEWKCHRLIQSDVKHFGCCVRSCWHKQY